MANSKKEKHTTYSVGPISYVRMKEIMEDLWKTEGVGREALRKEITGYVDALWHYKTVNGTTVREYPYLFEDFF